MDISGLEELIKGRRSIRQWKKEEVPDERLLKAIELATWAPNGGNFQGWQFIVVKNSRVIGDIALSVQATMDKVAAWPDAARWPEEIKRFQQNISFFKNAPVCIAVFVQQYQSVLDKLLASRGCFDYEARQILSFRRSAPTAIQSAAAAVTTLLLAFHQMGLGAVWLTAPLIAKGEIETMLNPPQDMELVSLVAVGVPNESPQKDRRPVKEVVRFVE